MSAFTQDAEQAPPPALADALKRQNLKLIEFGAHHRWVIRNGTAESVTVEEPIFSDMNRDGCRRVTGYRPARRARCNGDGTVTTAVWSNEHRDWIFVREKAA